MKFNVSKINLLLLLVLLVAIALRFYRLDGYLTFLGDEGRDMLVMKNILREGDLPFIGPASSVGNVYLGPLYYYMMAVSMFIFGLNPVVAAGMVASIGVATVYLIYQLGRTLFDKWSALTAAWLYAISPVTILASKSSWNPNPAPFFSLLTAITLHKFFTKDNWMWLILTGSFTSAAVQMHYLTLPLIPAVILILIYWLFSQKNRPMGTFIKGLLGFTVSFNIVMLPWWLFEYKHEFPNTRGIFEIFFGSKASVGVQIVSLLEKFYTTLTQVLIGHYLTSGLLVLSIGVLVLVLLTVRRGFKNPEYKSTYLFLGTILLVGLIIVNLYKGDVYDHYIGYLAPFFYLIFGSFWLMAKDKKWMKFGFALLIGVLTYFNLMNTPLNNPPNNQLQRTQQIAQYVIERAGDKPFNFALIAKNNYDSAYQFYFNELGTPPKVVQVERTDQLFVVCEDMVCEPTTHPKHEIAAFGMTKIEFVDEFAGVKVFKLIANPSGKPG